jgi:hypothetical protein
MTSIQRAPPHCSISGIANLRCHPWSFRSFAPPRILVLGLQFSCAYRRSLHSAAMAMNPLQSTSAKEARPGQRSPTCCIDLLPGRIFAHQVGVGFVCILENPCLPSRFS